MLYGPVATITAEAEQSAIQVGGKTFIVVTATDKGGNPVVGVRAGVKSGATGVVGPVGSNVSTEVTVDNNVDKDTNGNQKADTGDYPACGNQVAAADDPGTADTDETAPGLLSNGNDVGAGTNAKGQCVIEVEAQDPNPGTANDAARGRHTITINALAETGSLANPKVEAVEVTIDVGGPPDSIMHDAPERMDPLAEITVSLTVLDDEGVRVGEVHYSVVKVSDDGVITSAAAGRTSDGRAKFSYLAPSTPGTAQFLVRTWNKAHDAAGAKQTARAQILIEIAEEAMEEPDEPMPDEDAMPEGDATLSVTGNLGVFSGGSLADLAAAAGDACPGGAIIGAQDGGEWQLWSSSAPDFANIGFTSAFADGFSGTTPVWVTSCEADSMGDEG